MKTRQMLFFAVPCLLLAGGLLLHQLPWQRWALERRLDDLMRMVEKQSTETEIAALRRAADIAAFFTVSPKIDINSDWGAIRDRRQLARLVYAGRKRMTSLDLALRDKQVKLASDGTAETFFTANAVVKAYGERNSDIYEMRLVWARTNSTWLITSAEPITTIRHPARHLQP